MFKAILGYEGVYEVSDEGQIRRLYKTRLPRILEPSPRYSGGYLAVSLSINNIRRTFDVHRLVAIAHIPNPRNLPQINHKDGVKTNNDISNLEWLSARDNCLHAIKAGLITQHGRPKKIVRSICMDTGKISTYQSIAAATEKGFYQSAISNCINGKQKSHLGYRWKHVTI